MTDEQHRNEQLLARCTAAEEIAQSLAETSQEQAAQVTALRRQLQQSLLYRVGAGDVLSVSSDMPTPAVTSDDITGIVIEHSDCLVDMDRQTSSLRADLLDNLR